MSIQVDRLSTIKALHVGKRAAQCLAQPSIVEFGNESNGDLQAVRLRIILKVQLTGMSCCPKSNPRSIARMRALTTTAVIGVPCEEDLMVDGNWFSESAHLKASVVPHTLHRGIV